MKSSLLIVFLGIICYPFLALAQDEIQIQGNKYHMYGPNTNWQGYLKVGGNGRGTAEASVVSTNGNLHLDSKDGMSIYLNHYSQSNTLLNTQGGFVGIGNYLPGFPLHITSSIENHQIKLEGLNGKHTWIKFQPSGPNVINWQIGVNTNGYSIYDESSGSYRLTISNAGNLGIGTSSPDPSAGVHMYQNRYTLYGPNSNWGAYLQVGGNGRTTTYASVVSTNGNLHLDSQNGFATYLNHYSLGNTYLNVQGGSVGIGTTAMGAHRLAVEGSIGAREVKVQAGPGWPDYVFEESYDLRTIEETKNFIDENGHLPEIPPASEMEKNGIPLGEMNMILLKKVEELTLYLIEQNRQNQVQQSEIEAMKSRIIELESR